MTFLRCMSDTEFLIGSFSAINYYSKHMLLLGIYGMVGISVLLSDFVHTIVSSTAITLYISCYMTYTRLLMYPNLVNGR